MKIILVRNIDSIAASVKSEPSKKNKKTVESILFNVQTKGDSAIRKYEKKFGGTSVLSLRVSNKEIQNAYSQVSQNQLIAIKKAQTLLKKSETAIKNQLKNSQIKLSGTKISKSFVAIDSVGCYVPGGLARYPSSAIMSVVPAKIAGVKRIVVVSPPNKNGKIDPLTIVAADICGATEIYKVGGAQAIAALAYGTKTITQVDKIVGPGGPFVTLAKTLVSDTIAIDMLAGPTELGIIADNTADPRLVATDLISQAEHSSDTFCFLITKSVDFARKVRQSVNEEIAKSERSIIVKTSLEKNGFLAVCKTDNEIITLANKLAPEHLQVITKKPNKIASNIKTSGLTLIGKYSPSSASDYLLGTNHILPTRRFGRTRGSLSVLDFMKLRTEVQASKKTLEKISNDMKLLTDAEGLFNHYKAVRSRFE